MNAVPGFLKTWRGMKRAGASLLLTASLGCSALTPLRGVPSQQFPDDRANLRSGRETIDLSLLGQSPAPHYLLDSGDVLGVYIEGLVGKPQDAPPVYFPQNGDFPPSMGYPIPIREDGTMSIPLVGVIPVRGLTISQVEEKIRHTLTVEKKFFDKGRDRIAISLQKPRAVNVLVIRQETGSSELGQTSGNQGSLTIGVTKRGTAKLVTLPAYKNDVLHALTDTGGLPGLDAENTIYVIRRRGQGGFGPGPYGPTIGPAGKTTGTGGFGAGGYGPGGIGPDGIGPGCDPQVGQNGPQMEVLNERGVPMTPTRNASLPIQKMSWQSPSQRTPYNSGRYAASKWQMPTRPQSPVQHAAAWDESGVDEQAVIQTAALQDRNPETAFLDDTQGGQLPAPSIANLPPEQTPVPPTRPGASYYSQTPARPSAWQPPAYPPQAGPGMQPNPFPTQGPLPPQGQFPMQGQFAPQGQFPAQSQFAPQGHFAPQGQFPAAAGFYQPGPIPNNCDYQHILERFGRNSQITRIPVRLQPGEQLNITEQDIILNDGDIVFIESRETEIFYTGGLLGGGQYVLPRDYDLDVLGAVSIASGRNASSSGTGWGNHIGGISAMNQDVSVSASDVVVLRQLPNGGQIPIKVDLNKAMRDPSHRVRIMPGDYIILQYKCHEAIAAFVERNLLAGGLIGIAATGGTGTR